MEQKKKSNCFILVSKASSSRSSQVISNKLCLQWGPFWFWHNCLSALLPKTCSPWLMIYKIKGCLHLVFLAECKACCRSLCSWQERRLIIFTMKGRILKTPLWDAPGWLQSGLQEWWASSLIFFSPGYLLLLCERDSRNSTQRTSIRLKLGFSSIEYQVASAEDQHSVTATVHFTAR